MRGRPLFGGGPVGYLAYGIGPLAPPEPPDHGDFDCPDCALAGDLCDDCWRLEVDRERDANREWEV